PFFSSFILHRSSLAFQVLCSLHVNRCKVVVEIQEDRQCDGRLGGCEDDHEYGKNLAIKSRRAGCAAVSISVERDKVDVGGVENQLHAHEDSDGVTLNEDRQQAADEHERGQDQEMLQADRHHAFFYRRPLARYAAPIITTSSSTLASSNGTR